MHEIGSVVSVLDSDAESMACRHHRPRGFHSLGFPLLPFLSQAGSRMGHHSHGWASGLDRFLTPLLRILIMSPISQPFPSLSAMLTLPSVYAHLSESRLLSSLQRHTLPQTCMRQCPASTTFLPGGVDLLCMVARCHLAVFSLCHRCTVFADEQHGLHASLAYGQAEASCLCIAHGVALSLADEHLDGLADEQHGFNAYPVTSLMSWESF